MISLSDDQLQIVMGLAQPLAPWQRRAFLETVARKLSGQIIGDGSVHAAAIAAQREVITSTSDDVADVAAAPAYVCARHLDSLQLACLDVASTCDAQSAETFSYISAVCPEDMAQRRALSATQAASSFTTC